MLSANSAAGTDAAATTTSPAVRTATKAKRQDPSWQALVHGPLGDPEAGSLLIQLPPLEVVLAHEIVELVAVLRDLRSTGLPPGSTPRARNPTIREDLHDFVARHTRHRHQRARCSASGTRSSAASQASQQATLHAAAGTCGPRPGQQARMPLPRQERTPRLSIAALLAPRRSSASRCTRALTERQAPPPPRLGRRTSSSRILSVASRCSRSSWRST